jgi:hypothetical protein
MESVRQRPPDCWEQNIPPRRRMGVPAAGVCLIRSSGEMALAPHLGILGRGVHQVNGQWGPIGPAVRPTLGAALLVSREPRDRMGFRNSARQHARYQLEWHVYRISRSFMDWRWFYGAFGAGPARKSGLFREAHRAGTRHGRCRDGFRRATRAAVPRSSSFSLQHRFLTSSYTMVAVARMSSRCLGRADLDSPPSSGMAFEVV